MFRSQAEEPVLTRRSTPQTTFVYTLHLSKKLILETIEETALYSLFQQTAYQLLFYV